MAFTLIWQNAKRASAAAAPLAAWVTANVKYSYVLEKIEPLEKEQAGLLRWEVLLSQLKAIQTDLLVPHLNSSSKLSLSDDVCDNDH